MKQYLLSSNIKDGTILHTFDWSFKTIINELPNIASAGFKSIQVSPIQGTKDSTKDPNKWWILYQPINQSIGNAQLGTYDDFKLLCSEADKYGISIIVDVVMNHMANNGNPDNLDTKVDSIFKNPNFYHNLGQCIDWNSRHDITQLGIGMPDLNTQSSDVQVKAISFLNQCIDAGADGFRFDAAKHIETDIGLDSNKGWSGNYWSNVLGSLKNRDKLFIYGEILQDGSVDNVSSYETFMNVTASILGSKIRSALSSENLSLIDPTLSGIDSGKAVDFFETHDTYEDGTSRNLTDIKRKMGWAIAASRQGATPLFFDRPTGDIGTEGDFLWKDSDIVAINEFHNVMVGQNEYLRWTNNNETMLIDRGKVGTIIINDGDNDYISADTNLANGTYVNHGTAYCILTVLNGNIKGFIPKNSIIILYDNTLSADIPKEFSPHLEYKIDYDSSALIQGNIFTIYYNGDLTDSNKLFLHWGYNNWINSSNTPMSKNSNGYWEVAITIPNSATVLDFDFTNGLEWDNNSNEDWHLQVWSIAVPVQVYPSSSAHKDIQVYYNGSLTSSSDSMILHWGYNKFDSPTDKIMTKQDDGIWSAIISPPPGSYMVNMCFKNNLNLWDNNNHINYNYSVSV